MCIMTLLISYLLYRSTNMPTMAGLIGYGSDEEEEREKKDDSRAGMEVH